MRKLNLLACLSLLSVLSFSAVADDEVQSLVVDNGAGGGHSAYWNRLRDNTNSGDISDSGITTVASSTRSYVAAAAATQMATWSAFNSHIGSGYSSSLFSHLFTVDEYSATQVCAKASND